MVRRLRRWGVGRVALAAAGVVVVLLVVLQLVAPRVAEHVMRERAGRYGRVLEAHISAFPAVDLLWEHAQKASLRYASASMSQQQAVDELWSARGVNELQLSAASLQVGSVRLQNVSMHKRGNAIEMVGSVNEAALRNAAPAGTELLEVSAAGEHIEARGAAGVFGAKVSARGNVVVSEGAIVFEPQGLLGGFTRVTLFSDARLHVQTLSLTPLAGAATTWSLRLRATLVGS
jgi:hypothetical protein